jgi:hypothetical protein
LVGKDDSCWVSDDEECVWKRKYILFCKLQK